MSLDLLAFGPHPDDVELSCGGWLALASARGQRTGIVDLTAGELATNGTVDERRAEAEAAAEVLGLTSRDNLGLPDGGIRADDTEQLAAVVRVVRAHRPLLVLAPHPEARHPDHEAAGELLKRALFFAGLAKFRPDLGPSWRPKRLLTYPQRHEVRASFVVDVSEVYARKEQAIRCHRSQLGGAPTLVNSSLGIEAFTVRDRYWGASIGVRYGEPYCVAGPLPLADPVAHFAEAPTPVLVPPR